MKLVVAIIANDDANKIQRILVEENFMSTRLATTSGYLRARNATFIIGTTEEKLSKLLEIIELNSKKRVQTVPNTIVNEFGTLSALPVRVEVGGATIFVLEVAQFLKF